MNTEETRKREGSPRLKARLAGAFYFLSVASAIFAEAFVRGKLLYAAGLIPVSCFAVATLLIYGIFKPVNRSVALLAALFNLLSLAIEALELHFGHVNAALALHGIYCLMVGYLVFRSTFLPRILGAPMAFAGLCWLTSLSPPLAGSLHRVIEPAGLVGEGSLMLWLLVMGVDDQKGRAD
jgi:hypothetical protein